MVLGRTHQVTSLCLGEGATLALMSWAHLPANLLGADLVVCGFFGTWWGSLLPDIDSSNSLITQTFGQGGKMISHWLSHRGLTHTLWAWLLTVLPLYLLRSWMFDNIWWQKCGWMLLAGICFGYLCHLIEDSFSIAGINWLYPVHKVNPRKRRHRYKTGGKLETCWRIVMFTGVIALSILLGSRWI